MVDRISTRAPIHPYEPEPEVDVSAMTNQATHDLPTAGGHGADLLVTITLPGTQQEVQVTRRQAEVLLRSAHTGIPAGVVEMECGTGIVKDTWAVAVRLSPYERSAVELGSGRTGDGSRTLAPRREDVRGPEEESDSAIPRQSVEGDSAEQAAEKRRFDERVEENRSKARDRT